MEPVRCPAEGLGHSTKAELPQPPSRTAAQDQTYPNNLGVIEVITDDRLETGKSTDTFNQHPEI